MIILISLSATLAFLILFFVLKAWYRDMVPKKSEVDILVQNVVEFYKGRSIYETSKKFDLSSRHVLQILTKEGVFND